MTLDSRLLAIVVCPEDHGALYPLGTTDEGDTPAFLYNPRLKRRYHVVGGIPNLLPDEAETVDDATHTELVAAIEVDGITPTGPEAP